ncbi:DUF5700 domain-containing putative Zn-dependent protease [Pontibacter akesuensis]|uniref:Peptidase MA superfamily protein n=1 Tax=Pontibacter akesuensis TaxID=388950 RepID=A0A1I7FGA7_9BACT|nr:DUF5700 domain-containing putative Zn-dependent protease [Pontibacter akesuensis]GHA62310.1 hypothetical protein GCM10007389_13770 [Pontibacter akesuensis]SFU35208.1 hypothetical protein SAMN04487941_0179 [Pontibacter akesuensis]
MKTLFTLFVALTFSHLLQAQSIDATAAVRYFELTDSLRQDKPFSDALWKSFLTLEGNAQYIQNQAYTEKYLNRFRKDMEVVYMPQHDSLLRERLKDPQQNYNTYLIHYYKANEPQLREFLQNILADEEAYLASLYKVTYTMLPKRMHLTKPEATLYFNALGNDAVANRGNLVLTLSGTYIYDKSKYGILGGHELHHLVRAEKKYTIAEKDKSLFLMLGLLLNEGAPDLIDKRFTMSEDMPEDMRWGAYLLQLGEKQMPKLDEALLEMAAGTKTYTSQEIKQQVVGMSGHIPGFYMADIIERNGLKKKLIANIDDPFQFVYLYNKAAKKDKAKPFVFSKEAMAYLKQVEVGAKTKN